MADGYARATGQAGVALVVCGPGVLNAATPLATAFTDSVPLLLLSGQVPGPGVGLRSGYYHENDQITACATLTKWRARADNVLGIVPQLDRAIAVLTEGRPGPVLFEVPLDVLRAECPNESFPPIPAASLPRKPGPEEVAGLSRLVESWRRPLLLAGGGVLRAAPIPGLSNWLNGLVRRSFTRSIARVPFLRITHWRHDCPGTEPPPTFRTWSSSCRPYSAKRTACWPSVAVLRRPPPEAGRCGCPNPWHRSTLTRKRSAVITRSIWESTPMRARPCGVCSSCCRRCRAPLGSRHRRPVNRPACRDSICSPLSGVLCLVMPSLPPTSPGFPTFFCPSFLSTSRWSFVHPAR